LPRGQVYVFDKGYCDYNWWYQISCSEACFVTNGLKSKRPYQPRGGQNLLDPQQPQILADHLVSFNIRRPAANASTSTTAPRFRQSNGGRKRRRRPALVLATNDLETPAHISAEALQSALGH